MTPLTVDVMNRSKVTQFAGTKLELVYKTGEKYIDIGTVDLTDQNVDSLLIRLDNADGEVSEITGDIFVVERLAKNTWGKVRIFNLTKRSLRADFAENAEDLEAGKCRTFDIAPNLHKRGMPLVIWYEDAAVKSFLVRNTIVHNRNKDLVIFLAPVMKAKQSFRIEMKSLVRYKP